MILKNFFVFKQKTAYELRISDCSSDVCSSDLLLPGWIDAHRNDHQAPARPDQVQAVCTQLSQALDSALQAQLAKQLASWQPMLILQAQGQLGRASCRDRVCQYV